MTWPKRQSVCHVILESLVDRIMKPKSILVCGTNYGRVYLRAIDSARERYRLLGILARGSRRSQKLSEDYGVPLFNSVSDLPTGADIACFALGSSNFRAVLDLLDRGVHVLCEHPQGSEALEGAFESARRNRVRFHLNSHFGDLEAPAAFVACLWQLEQVGAPSFLEMVASDRALYAGLDTLKRGLCRLQGLELEECRQRGGFRWVVGSWGGVPITFRVQASGGPQKVRLADRSRGYLVDLRLSVGFEAGVLSLLSLAGPVIWNCNYNRRRSSSELLWKTIYGNPALTAGQLGQERIAANLGALDRLAEEIETGRSIPDQAPSHILEVSRLWETVGRQLADGVKSADHRKR